MIDPLRIRTVNDIPADPAGTHVLYWMTAARRLRHNAGLERAVEHARSLRRPLWILEALRCDYRWASDRLHKFVIDGMIANGRAFADHPVTYLAYVEPRVGAGRGLLERLAQNACVVVGDDFPCFFLPRMVAAAGRRLGCRFEVVDSNGLYPMRATDRVLPMAHAFRRHLHKELHPHLTRLAQADPLAGAELPKVDLPADLYSRWPQLRLGPTSDLAALPIDHTVAPALAGGAEEAQRVLDRFLNERLEAYAESRNEPERDVASCLSPYLHFGHIAAQDVFLSLVKRERWTPDVIAGRRATGQRHGFFGLSQPAEAFLDEFLVWRELGYNFCAHRSDYDSYSSLPAWARQTLAKHASDPRPFVYDLGRLERADTHDPLWNAAQQQLRRQGRIHNYLRMLWGKKILEWSETPELAFEVMIELNNKYALDGRNPNSYTGIAWVLGRYDRAWGPERPIFGKIRYMTSANTARKVRVKNYIAEWTS